MSEKVIQVGILGAGDGALSLLSIFTEDKEVQIVGLAYRNEDRPAVAQAREMGISLYSDFRELVEAENVELLIEATGSLEVQKYLAEEKLSDAELLTANGAWMLWRMVEENKQRQDEMSQTLKEREALYKAGVSLSGATSMEQTLELILKSALEIMEMAAGSIALYDEEKGELQIKVSLGFEHDSAQKDYSWQVRLGGFTSKILSGNEATVVEDLDHESFDKGPLEKFGIRSIIAIPLRVDRRIVGVLYVDDFKPRKFVDHKIKLMGLLGAQASAAIEKAKLLERAEVMAVTDELTKLYNHRYFMKSLIDELKRTDRYKHPLCLCMIDVDHFKRYNDSYGHLKGNDVLVNLATILQTCARETDIVARYGGEEFAVIFTQAGYGEATVVAERMRSEVEKFRFPGDGKGNGQNVTISLGLSTCPTRPKNAKNIIERADQALYHSKGNGRNQVSSYLDINKS